VSQEYIQLQSDYINRLEHCVSLLERSSLQKSAAESSLDEVASILAETQCTQSSIVSAIRHRDPAMLEKIGSEEKSTHSLGVIVKKSVSDDLKKYSKAELELFSNLNLI
jgi:hypothetical protein